MDKALDVPTEPPWHGVVYGRSVDVLQLRHSGVGAGGFTMLSSLDGQKRQ